MVEMIRNTLLSMAQPSYKDFQCKLMPTVSADTVIGIRTPKLRSLAEILSKNENIEAFLKNLPHKYYEENNLHAFLIEQISDYTACIEALDRFLPYVDNWATCDSMKPKCFSRNTDSLLEPIGKWLRSDATYTIRFGIGMLMTHYLDEHFDPQLLQRVAAIETREYYVKMMIAWYFATALAKQWDAAIIYLEQNKLSPWIHNKTIQKAIESYRISPEQKTYLRSLKQSV